MSVWILPENLHKPEGFEQLFFMAGSAGKVVCLVENGWKSNAHKRECSQMPWIVNFRLFSGF